MDSVPSQWHTPAPCQWSCFAADLGHRQSPSSSCGPDLLSQNSLLPPPPEASHHTLHTTCSYTHTLTPCCAPPEALHHMLHTTCSFTHTLTPCCAPHKVHHTLHTTCSYIHTHSACPALHSLTLGDKLSSNIRLSSLCLPLHLAIALQVDHQVQHVAS